MNWIERLLGTKRRKKRGPNKLPSELTAEQKAAREVRAARARARRRREKGS